jgi:hypothetical protein
VAQRSRSLIDVCAVRCSAPYHPRSCITTSRMTLRRYPRNGRPDLCNVFQHIEAPHNGSVRSYMQHPNPKEPEARGTHLTACLVNTRHKARHEAVHNRSVPSMPTLPQSTVTPKLQPKLRRSANRAPVLSPAIWMLADSDQKLKSNLESQGSA